MVGISLNDVEVRTSDNFQVCLIQSEITSFDIGTSPHRQACYVVGPLIYLPIGSCIKYSMDLGDQIWYSFQTSEYTIQYFFVLTGKPLFLKCYTTDNANSMVYRYITWILYFMSSRSHCIILCWWYFVCKCQPSFYVISHLHRWPIYHHIKDQKNHIISESYHIMSYLHRSPIHQFDIQN